MMGTSASYPIGVFDSGYGGLSVLREIINILPQYDYIYLGDNARVPYGIRPPEIIYKYTLECVNHLFDQGCKLVILACNTASAVSLQLIQQRDLPLQDPLCRVLGVIRPTAEAIGHYTQSGHIGILATEGTVNSLAYPKEIAVFFPDLFVFQGPCPMWVPLVENNEHRGPGADYFVKKDLDALLAKSPMIDTILLGCTHYPLLMDKIKQFIPEGIKVISQGEIVVKSLSLYLKRHPELEQLCGKSGARVFLTTASERDFNGRAANFFGCHVKAKHLEL